MAKLNYKYMHTIRGIPAFYHQNHQIVYASQYVEKLCDTLEQIRAEQKKSFEYRKSCGLRSYKLEYGYVKVVID